MLTSGSGGHPDSFRSDLGPGEHPVAAAHRIAELGSGTIIPPRSGTDPRPNPVRGVYGGGGDVRPGLATAS